VNVQRRPANPARNSLNEPDYGAESGYPTVYNNLAVRIEYSAMQMQWTPTGERVALPTSGAAGVLMYLAPDPTILRHTCAGRFSSLSIWRISSSLNSRLCTRGIPAIRLLRFPAVYAAAVAALTLPLV